MSIVTPWPSDLTLGCVFTFLRMDKGNCCARSGVLPVLLQKAPVLTALPKQRHALVGSEARLAPLLQWPLTEGGVSPLEVFLWGPPTVPGEPVENQAGIYPSALVGIGRVEELLSGVLVCPAKVFFFLEKQELTGSGSCKNWFGEP